jgi:hypothetical protein
MLLLMMIMMVVVIMVTLYLNSDLTVVLTAGTAIIRPITEAA